jgi:AcrR family transcriptional regulator
MSGTKTRTRGRPRQFDEESALDAITNLFWQKGYSQTSVTDLVEVSGVQKPSLYRIFGTKEELFARILRRYLATRMNMFSILIASTGPDLDGIHAFLSLMRDDVLSGTSQDGCLLVESSAELRGTTPGFTDFGSVYRAEVRELMKVLVAKAGGGDEQIEVRSQLLTTWFLGFDLSVRGGGDEDEIDNSIDAMHATVDTWSKPPPRTPTTLDVDEYGL